jgi:uncharacterized protein
VKVVIDTNILVSAVLRDRVPQDVVLFICETPGFEWVASSEIMAEYKAVLRRKKFDLPIEIMQEWSSFLDENVMIVRVSEIVEFKRDLKDEKFLSCALSVDASWLITGDKDFQDADKLVNTIILPASMFKRTVMDLWAR